VQQKLLDDFVGAQQHYRWDGEAKCVGSLEVQYELEPGGRFNRCDCGICAQQNLGGHDALMSDDPEQIRSIGHQTAVPGKIAEQRDGREPILSARSASNFVAPPIMVDVSITTAPAPF